MRVGRQQLGCPRFKRSSAPVRECMHVQKELIYVWQRLDLQRLH